MRLSCRGLNVSPWVTLFIGYILGYILNPFLQMWTCHCENYTTLEPQAFSGHVLPIGPFAREDFTRAYLNPHPSSSWPRTPKLGHPKRLAGEYKVRKELLVGVITAERYLPTRARAVYETWGSSVTKILFFVGADCNTSHPLVQHLPVVKLPGISDNVYPPQKKVFAVLRYMNEHYLDEFQWFLRADDDVYIRGDRLQRLLSSLDSNENIYLGRAGMGMLADIKRLGLKPHERYCMGGPGVVISHAALKALAPYLDRCLHAVDQHNEENPTNLWYNEDVELGRCISRVVNIQCSSSAEGREYFIMDYTSDALNPQTLWHNPLFRKLITFHPLKQPEHIYAVHHFYEVEKAQKVQQELQKLQTSITALCDKMPSSLHPPWQTMESCTVEMCAKGKTPLNSNFPFITAKKLPKIVNPSSWYEIVPWKHFSMTTEHDIGDFSSERGLHSRLRSEIAGMVSLVGHHINSARSALNELRPVEVVKGYTRFTAEVGREYILDIKFSEEDSSSRFVMERVRLFRPLEQKITIISEPKSPSASVNVVVPVLNADGMFNQFIAWFAAASVLGEVSPHLILSVTGDSDTLYTVQTVVANYTHKYPLFRATILAGKTNISIYKALELGVAMLENSNLIFATELSLRIDPIFFQNCLQNSIAGRKVYFPVPYIVYGEPDKGVPGPGRWGFYSQSSLCIYKSDFLKFAHSSKSLLEQVSQSDLEVFQAPDPSLVRVVKPVNCQELAKRAEVTEYCVYLLLSQQMDQDLVEYMHKLDNVDRSSLSFPYH